MKASSTRARSAAPPRKPRPLAPTRHDSRSLKWTHCEDEEPPVPGLYLIARTWERKATNFPTLEPVSITMGPDGSTFAQVVPEGNHADPTSDSSYFWFGPLSIPCAPRQTPSGTTY